MLYVVTPRKLPRLLASLPRIPPFPFPFPPAGPHRAIRLGESVGPFPRIQPLRFKRRDHYIRLSSPCSVLEEEKWRH